jgi:hypothetical protein
MTNILNTCSRLFASSFVLAAVLAVPLAAEGLDAPAGAQAPRLALGLYVGAARNSLVGTHLGVTPDRDHFFFGVHATLHVVRAKRWTFAYAPEVVPVLIISNNPKYRTTDYRDGRFAFEDGRGPVTGFAVSPIGLEQQVSLTSRLRLYNAQAGGVVWFTRAVPDVYARSFNFTFEVGGGLLWRYHPRDSLRIGYKFHHLSNAYTARSNPGIDGAVFLVGIERTLGGRR